MKYTEKIGMEIENYARENIAEGQEEYGEFMYHAELIKRGHWDIHYQDLATMADNYKEIMMSMTEVYRDAYEHAITMLGSWE